MFSNVIDHIVIYDAKSNTPIFVVEATIRLKDILKNEMGDMDLGQCHDQLKELQLLGNVCPFGALTSVNSTIITWLESDLHREVLRHHIENGFFNRRLFRTIESLPNHSRPDVPLGSQSPPKLCTVDKQSQATKLSTDSQPPSCDVVAKRRSIVFSTEAFKQDRLVDVFVNAVFCSLDGYYLST